MLVDTHAHLDDSRFKEDLALVIARAEAAGVGAIVTVGTDLESSQQAVALAQRYPGVYAAIGVHPHEASKAGPNTLAELARLSQNDAVVAIGEIGLDFHYNFSPPEKQREIFITQLELARQLNKPVVVHDREAHAEMMSILQGFVGATNSQNLRGVLHCFSGDEAMAQQAIEMGFYLSFGGPVTFENARRLQALVRTLPLERILLETDCPYLTPHPHRGKRNEPAYVRLVAERVAMLKGMTFEQVAMRTTTNASRLFGFAIPQSCQMA
jgi:TatD DNase family protein